MEDITRYRDTIDKIDDQMAGLFEERMNVCRKIAEYKKEHGLSVWDEKREQDILQRNTKSIKSPELEEYYVNFMKDTLTISSRYQERLMAGMKVAYSGVEGAFAYIAAKAMFPEASLICKSSFSAAYNSVENGECDCVVLPLENSYAGEVSTVMDLTFSGGLFVNQVMDLPIKHNLLGIHGSHREDIRKVISHPMALSQCSEYISSHGFEIKNSGNTATASQKVMELNDVSVAAIASKETAGIMGLDVLDENIQDSGLNTTRFAAFSRYSNRRSTGGDDENFILVFTVKNEAGALAQTLNIMGAHGYNMRSLRSRPMRELMWNYYFFVEAEGNINTQNGKDMLQELSAICGGLKLVGSYRTFSA